jgi:hypothetical protein
VLLPDTFAVAVIERDGVLVSVALAAWKEVPAEEQVTLWQTAVRRTIETTIAKRQDVRHPSGASFVAWTGDDHTVSTLALDVERLLPADPRWGALVAVPRSQIVVAHALGAPEVVPMIGQLALMAQGIHAEGPPPLVSPHLYWVKGGHCEPLAVDVDLPARRMRCCSPSERFANEILLPLAGDRLSPA